MTHPFYVSPLDDTSRWTFVGHVNDDVFDEGDDYDEIDRDSWEDLTMDVERSLDGALRVMDQAMELTRDEWARPRPIWWVLMTEVPFNIEVRTQWEETQPRYRPREHWMWLSTGERTYSPERGLALPPAQSWGINKLGKKWVNGQMRLYVLANQPPGFGWWMPTLEVIG